jgi:hypothetical protein
MNDVPQTKAPTLGDALNEALTEAAKRHASFRPRRNKATAEQPDQPAEFGDALSQALGD